MSDGAVGRGGLALRAWSQAAVDRSAVPVIWSQMAKRTVISARWSAAVIRWRRGRKWGEMPMNAARNRRAAPTERKPLHRAFAPTGGLAAALGPVVEALG
ncbi:hypothetical protein GCM10018966_040220 [Streptomyces yanii]